MNITEQQITFTQQFADPAFEKYIKMQHTDDPQVHGIKIFNRINWHIRNIIEQHHGILGLKIITQKLNNAKIQSILQFKVLQNILNYIELIQFPQLQYQSLLILLNLSNSAPNEFNIHSKLIDFELIPLLKAHLRSPIQTINLIVIKILQNIVNENYINRKLVLNDGFGDILLQKIKIQASKNVKKQEYKLLSKLCQVDCSLQLKNFDEAVNQICIGICDYIQDSSDQIICYHALQNLNTFIDPKLFNNAVSSTAIISKTINILFQNKQEDSGLAHQCLLFLFDLVKYSQFQMIKKLIKTNIIECLQKLLTHHDANIRIYSISLASEIYSRVSIDKFMFFQQLLLMLQHGDNQMKKQICTIFQIIAITQHLAVSHLRRKRQVKQEIINLLGDEDQNIVQSALACLQSWLEFDQKRISEYCNQASTFASCFKYFGVIPVLKKLTQHSDDSIHQAAVYILSKYYEIQ